VLIHLCDMQTCQSRAQYSVDYTLNSSPAVEVCGPHLSWPCELSLSVQKVQPATVTISLIPDL
jgi:hypothetical protein